MRSGLRIIRKEKQQQQKKKLLDSNATYTPPIASSNPRARRVAYAPTPTPSPSRARRRLPHQSPPDRSSRRRSRSPPPQPLPPLLDRYIATSTRYYFSLLPFVSFGVVMLQASSELQPAAAAGMWVPGMSPQAVDAGSSARAQEIARRREEMLGMLHDLPESEYELSLTDLVEKAGGVAPPSPSPSEGKAEPGLAGTGRTASGRQSEQQQPAATGRPERRGSARRWDSGGGSFRSSSDGVLLNFYMPRSFTRSFTAPRTGPGQPPSVSGGRSASACSDRNKRERDGETVRCWSLLWDRRWRKSSRGDHGNESAIRAAILKAAKHNASSPTKKI